jgi:hypothetical protein
LEVDNKLIKCKVIKTSLTIPDYNGKLGAMNPVSGFSKIKITIPVKNITSGIYPIILNNKIGIATTPYINENDKGHLPEIEITK